LGRLDLSSADPTRPIAAGSRPNCSDPVAFLSLCAEDTDFFDPHFLGGTPPGGWDGAHASANDRAQPGGLYAYTGKKIDGHTAVELGLANECLPREELLPRAWEIARMMMEGSKMTRHLTHAILSRPWRQALVQDMGFHLMHQSYEMTTNRGGRAGEPHEERAPFSASLTSGRRRWYSQPFGCEYQRAAAFGPSDLESCPAEKSPTSVVPVTVWGAMNERQVPG